MDVMTRVARADDEDVRSEIEDLLRNVIVEARNERDTVITVVTPMTTPNRVRRERSRLARSEARAMRMASTKFIYLAELNFSCKSRIFSSIDCGAAGIVSFGGTWWT